MLNAGIRGFDSSKLTEEELFNRISELEKRIASLHSSLKNQNYLEVLKQALEDLNLERQRRRAQTEYKSGVVIETDPTAGDLPFIPWPNQIRK
jgi:TolA-binding protein